jgi:serine/threonine protein kinase
MPEFRALEVLPPDLALGAHRRERLSREAKAVAALNHPSIVTVYSLQESAGTAFMTMELIEGRTLAALIPRRGIVAEDASPAAAVAAHTPTIPWVVARTNAAR